MKRGILVFALVLFALPLVFARKFDAPVHWYEPANLGLYLPTDTEIGEEDGTWYAVSEVYGFFLTIQDIEEYIAPEDISEETLAEALAEAEIEDFTFIKVQQNNAVTYAYGQGTTTNDDGEAIEGMFGILTNEDVPDSSFMFMVLAESLISEKTGPAVEDFIDDIISMAPIK
jgi:hypothetical protein